MGPPLEAAILSVSTKNNDLWRRHLAGSQPEVRESRTSASSAQSQKSETILVAVNGYQNRPPQRLPLLGRYSWC